jgi:hypothetical protein
MKITSKDQLKEGDRIRVSFEAEVFFLDSYDQCTQVNHIDGDGENTHWCSYLYLNDDFEDIGLTVEKVFNRPGVKRGQVWQDPESGERFSVYYGVIPESDRFINLNSGAVFSEEVFFNLHPKAELILDA